MRGAGSQLHQGLRASSSRSVPENRFTASDCGTGPGSGISYSNGQLDFQTPEQENRRRSIPAVEKSGRHSIFRLLQCLSPKAGELRAAHSGRSATSGSAHLAAQELDFGSHPDVLCSAPEIVDWDVQSFGQRLLSNRTIRASLDILRVKASPSSTLSSSSRPSRTPSGTPGDGNSRRASSIALEASPVRHLRHSEFVQRPRRVVQRQASELAVTVFPWASTSPRAADESRHSSELACPPVAGSRQPGWTGAKAFFGQAKRSRTSSDSRRSSEVFKASRPSDVDAVGRANTMESAAAFELEQHSPAVKSGIASICEIH